MRVTIVIDGARQVVLPLGFDMTLSLVSNLSDSIENTEAFTALAGHESAAVRQAVAHKDNLAPEAVTALVDDTEIDVLTTLMFSDGAQRLLEERHLKKLIAVGSRVAEAVAINLYDLENVSAKNIASSLVDHPDPYVRGALAGNHAMPTAIIQALLRDEDRSVRAASQTNLLWRKQ